MSIEFGGGFDRRETMARLGMGVIRVTLLFGSAAIAIALILTPLLDRRTRDVAGYGIDPLTTGSVPQSTGGGNFTVRRSVLQPSPDAVCVIRDDGTMVGSC
ncbi:hypothetical protein [Chelativorans sp.]|uniref:hypothetical protein n=1 Tax=Chelativorans sp. TaxID=2203393 RepID=UPI002812629E|nr:hypothetical protein [Chelativorans sp.]